MLPTFPQIEKTRSRLNVAAIHRLTEEISPILGQMKRHIIYEGEASSIQRYDETHETNEMTTVSAELKIDIVEVNKFTQEVLFSYLRSAAEQIAKDATQHLFSVFDRVTAQTGNVVDANGAPFDEKMVLDMIEKMEHAFNADGSWVAPTILMPEDQAKKILATQEKSGVSAAFDERLNAILEKKRDAFFSREASRVLVG